MKTQLKVLYDNINHETGILSEKVLPVFEKEDSEGEWSKQIGSHYEDNKGQSNRFSVSKWKEVRLSSVEKNYYVYVSDGSTNN